MKSLTVVLVSVAFLALVAGCTSPPLVPAANTGAGPASTGGSATADVNETVVTPATAFAQPTGQAEANAVTAKVDRQNTNTAAGESVNGVIFPGTAAYMTLMNADEIIVSLSERIRFETEKEEPDSALLDSLYEKFAARGEVLKETMSAVSPDFASLEMINVMILICKDNGAAEGETGDAQSQVVAEAMAKVVASTVEQGE